MEVGNRVFFDQDGDLVFLTGERSGDVLPDKEITKLDFVDLEYGALKNKKLLYVDVVTKTPIFEDIPIFETEEQRRIRELEDALLMQTDNEIGGIL